MKLSKRSLVTRTLVGLSGLALIVSPTVLAAQDATVSNTSVAQPVAAQKLAEKMTDRIIDYKAKQAVKLAAAEEAKLKGSCKAAQAKVKATAIKLETANTARTKVYDAITKQLTGITARIKDADVETKDLEAATKELATKINKYKDDYKSFKTNISDTSELDCLTDPTAFKVSLLTTRAARLTLVTSATTVREYIPTIAQKLTVAKNALSKDAATDTTAEPTTNADGGTQ